MQVEGVVWGLRKDSLTSVHSISGKEQTVGKNKENACEMPTCCLVEADLRDGFKVEK